LKPELEALLKAYDLFKDAPVGPEAVRLYAIYEAKLEETSQLTKIRRQALENALRKMHPRWVRANLPPGFPKELGFE
jgi:hypothetical protein